MVVSLLNKRPVWLMGQYGVSYKQLPVYSVGEDPRCPRRRRHDLASTVRPADGITVIRSPIFLSVQVCNFITMFYVASLVFMFVYVYTLMVNLSI